MKPYGLKKYSKPKHNKQFKFVFDDMNCGLYKKECKKVNIIYQRTIKKKARKENKKEIDKQKE